jgi:hypothetical protein
MMHRVFVRCAAVAALAAVRERLHAIVPPPPGPPPLPDHQAAVPQLSGHTTYAAFVDGIATATTGCGAHGPTPFSIPIGTFTTQ